MCYCGIVFVLNSKEKVKEEMKTNSPIKSFSAHFFLPYGVFLFSISGPLFKGN